MFEIESSKLAVDGTSGWTKAFAEQRTKDHTKTTSELKPLAVKAKIMVPAKLDEAHQRCLICRAFENRS